MNINFKKLISALLVAVMVFCSVPLSGFVGLELPEFNLFKADAAEKNIKNTITTTEVDTAVYPTSVSTTAESTDTVVTTTSLHTSGQCGDNLTWEFDKSTGTLTISGTGEMYNYGYNYNYNDFPPRPWEEYEDEIHNIVISDGVTTIGDLAFAWLDNDLATVIIPDSVKSIGNGAFHNSNGLVSVSIGSGVTSIGQGVFNYCHKFSTIIVDSANSVYSSDENGVLFNKDKTELIKYPMANTIISYMIPDSVTRFCDNAFDHCYNLVNITIPDSITSIGDWAFDGCVNLEEIIIPEGVKYIGSYAFHMCEKLKSVAIPASVTKIGNEIFRYCRGLETINVHKDNPCFSNDEYGVMFNKNKTKLIQYPINNSRKSYKIPDGVTEIDLWAFDDCDHLTHIVVPHTVKEIGMGAFAECDNLISINFPAKLSKISHALFSGCNNLTKVIIPNEVTSIDSHAFVSCGRLEFVHLPSNISKIDIDAFRDFSGYICSTEEDSFAKIYAKKNGIEFRICNGHDVDETVGGKCGKNLTWSLDIETGVLTITGTGDMWEFDGETPWYPYRSLIESVAVEEGATSICNRAFAWCSNIETATLPDSLVTIGGYAFMGCENLETLTLGKGIETIGEGGISLCRNLKNIRMYEGVTSVGDWAFAYNDSLEYVHFPMSVTTIGDNIFDTITPYICAETKDCYAKKYADKNGIEFRLCADHREVPDVNDKICGENLTWSLDIETGILTISGTGDMYNYSVSEAAPWYSHQPYIKSVVINDGVTSIGDYAFTDLPNLTKVTMANSVETIGSCAFEKCIRLSDIKISTGILSIGSYAFYECNSLESITIPDSVTELGENSFYNCNALKNLIIGDGLEVIGYNSFALCSNLKYVEIGSNVKRINGHAFSYCRNLQTVVLPKCLESIAAYAFNECNKLNSVYYEGTWEEWCEITFGYYNSDLLNASIYCNASAEDVPEDGSNPDNSGNKLEWNVNKSTGTLYINGTGAMDDYSGNVAPWYIYQSQVNTIVIGDGITSVGDYAFYDFISVTDVILPESMINIGDHAFEDCEILEYINFGNKVKTIGQYAFYNCDNLRDVTIPNSVISLGASAFSFSGVENLSIGKGLKEISTYAFYDCDNLRNLIIGENVETISTEAFAISSNLKNVFIPSDVTKIQDSAFDNCYNITDVYYEGTEKDWEAITFGYNNSSLLRATIHFGASADDIVEEETTMPDISVEYTTIVYPESTTMIPTTSVYPEETTIPVALSGVCGDNLTWEFNPKTLTLTVSGKGDMYDYASFSPHRPSSPWGEYNRHIERIVISDGVTSVGDFAFYCHWNVVEVSIADTVKDIGYASFAGCNSLAEITIPENVNSLGKYSIAYCYNLERVTIPASTSTIADNAFCLDYNLVRFTVDENNNYYSADKYGTLFNKDKTKLIKYPTGNKASEYTIPETVELICDGAFIAGYNLINVTIGSNVEIIGYNAFESCDSLSKIVIPDSVTTILAGAFNCCQTLERVEIGSGVSSISESAFDKCYFLKSFYVSKDNKFYTSDGYGVLYNKDRTKLIKYPAGNLRMEYIIRNDVVGINRYALYDSVNLSVIYFTGTEDEWLKIVPEMKNGMTVIFGINEDNVHDFSTATQGTVKTTYRVLYTVPALTTEGNSVSDYYNTTSATEKQTTAKYPATTVATTAKYPTTRPTGPYTTGVIVYPTTTGVHDFETTCATTAKYPTAETTTKVPSTTKKPAETTTTTTRVAETTTATKPSESMHTHTSQLIVIPATCTVNGMKYTVCRDCGEPIGETTILQAKGHSAGEWVTVVEPTTESVGKQVRNCTICGEKVDEREIPKLSTVVDKKTGVEMNFNSADYDGEVEIVVKEVFDGKAFDVVDTSVISSQKFIYDITMTVDGSETQPEGKVIIRIPLPEGYDSAKTFVYHVDSSTGKIEKMQAEYVDGYLVFETTHFSYYAVVESADISMKIRQPSTTTVNYGETLVLHADLGGKTLPDGYKIKWFTNSDGVTIKSGDNGTTCEVTSVKNGSVTVTARIVDKNGNEVKGADGKEISASQTIESKVSIWLRIVSFFKNLFGSNRIIAQTIFGK